jgi:hypothetical protein
MNSACHPLNTKKSTSRDSSLQTADNHPVLHPLTHKTRQDKEEINRQISVIYLLVQMACSKCFKFVSANADGEIFIISRAKLTQRREYYIILFQVESMK